MFKGILKTALLVAGFIFLGGASDVSYQYDALGRLTQVDYGGGKIVTYKYDAAGNRTSHKVEGAGLLPDPNAGGGIVVLPISGFIIIPLPGSVVGS
jgi:YD repeat-containing protein